MKKIKIIIADDHDVVRSGLKQLLKSNPEFIIAAEAKDGGEAVELTTKLKPDVLLVDISMPVMNGIEVTRMVRQANSPSKVLVFTIHENEEYVYQMIRAGANGYVLKNADRDEIFTAIKAVVAGEFFFSPHISQLLIQEYINRSRGEKPPAAEQPGDDKLTKRESEILGLIARGFTNTEIAQKLFLSVRTVNTHRTNLMQKLDIHETASLVRYALQHGFVKEEE